jgi:hypothetical protein
MPPVCIYVCLASSWTVGCIMFNIQQFIRHKSVPSQYEHSTSKRGFLRGVSEQNENFPENRRNDLIKFQQYTETSLLNKTA